ncbi:TPA: hypothetical protein RG728_002477 [Morganella morganii subsp. morganii]|uniref:Uncharacterized protein n=1 Tax=Morganella morganii TaxID=582 RepID=A0AAU8ZPE1_MORMO|nr:hypothetical protein [Morganella morganii]HDU8693359.1 hypothetical protein [Morganella morganii subsp. morganii]AWC94720.1 hypothetical protein AM380_14280 [Morganella morganii]EKW8484720.1 hypothetical protein [Morganella morganii]HAT3626680.1 hypothetical protein [Morganella morganii]HCU0880143.1 hypothetical protein [Morganella morganii]
MKNIIVTVMLLSCISSATVYARDKDSSCSAYVKSIQLNYGNYRFHIVDATGFNIKKSNDWSFTAKDKDIAQVLNLAYMLKHPVCIYFDYYKDSWEITNVELKN